MATSRVVRGAVAVVIAAASGSAVAEAQNFGWLTNGEIGYVTDYTTTGWFTCGTYLSRDEGFCSASGNSVTISTPTGAAMTLAFLGVSRVITARNFGQIVDMGVFHKTVTGDFLFPRTSNVNATLITFALSLNTSAPVAASRTFLAGYRGLFAKRLPYNCCDGFGTSTLFPVVPAVPPQRTYALSYSNVSYPTFTIDEDPEYVEAVVGLIPEPLTVSLVALGLLAMLGIGVRRRV